MYKISEILKKTIYEMDMDKVPEYKKIYYNESKKIIDILETIKINERKNILIQVIKPKNDIRIYSGLMNLIELERNKDFFSPVFEEDAYKNFLSDLTFLRKVNNKEQIELNSIPIILSEQEKDELLQNEFSGYFKTIKNQEVKFRFRVTKDDEYMKKFTIMYKTFLNNEKRWVPLNMPYLNHMYKIKIIDYADFDNIEGILGVDYDFDKFNDKAYKNYFAVWNIKEVYTFTNNIIKSNIKKMYRHQLNYYSNNTILIENTGNEKSVPIFNENRRLEIISENMKEQKWKILNIKSGSYNDDMCKFKVYSNEKDYDFLDMIDDDEREGDVTESEIRKYIEQIKDFEEYKLKYISMKVRAEKIQKYNYIKFIDDNNIIIKRKKQDIVLKFEVKERNTLELELISYVKSDLEEKYPYLNFLFLIRKGGRI